MIIHKKELELVNKYQKNMKEIQKQVKIHYQQIKEIKVFNHNKILINNHNMI